MNERLPPRAWLKIELIFDKKTIWSTSIKIPNVSIWQLKGLLNKVKEI